MTPSGTLTGIGARAGYPQVTVPAGYAAATRRPVNISFNGTAYTRGDAARVCVRVRAGVAAPPAGDDDRPELLPLRDDRPAEPISRRAAAARPARSCSTSSARRRTLDFSLETASAADLQSRLESGTLTSVAAHEGVPRADRRGEHERAGGERGAQRQPARARRRGGLRRAPAAGQARGPLEGLPVLVNDDVDVDGLPTTAGSVALQDSVPAGDSTLVARLRAGGADRARQDEHHRALRLDEHQHARRLLVARRPGLRPVRRERLPGGSSPGAAAAAAAGLAALTIGTGGVGRELALVDHRAVSGERRRRPEADGRSRQPRGDPAVSLTQETAGPIGRSVHDVAAALAAIAGPDPVDPATPAQPPVPDYLAALSADGALREADRRRHERRPELQRGRRRSRRSRRDDGHEDDPGAEPEPAGHRRPRAQRDVDAYLGALPAASPAHSLQEIIDYNLAHPDEALKYGQGTLIASNAVDLSDPATNAAYVSDRDTGRARLAL